MTLTPIQKAALTGELEDAAKEATRLAGMAAEGLESGADRNCLARVSIATSLAALTRAVAGVMRDELDED